MIPTKKKKQHRFSKTLKTSIMGIEVEVSNLRTQFVILEVIDVLLIITAGEIWNLL